MGNVRGTFRTSFVRASSQLTDRVPRRVVIDTTNWLIILHEQDLGDRTTIVTSYEPVLRAL